MRPLGGSDEIARLNADVRRLKASVAEARFKVAGLHMAAEAFGDVEAAAKIEQAEDELKVHEGALELTKWMLKDAQARQCRRLPRAVGHTNRDFRVRHSTGARRSRTRERRDGGATRASSSGDSSDSDGESDPEPLAAGVDVADVYVIKTAGVVVIDARRTA